jgi:hypothetical protein
MLVAMELFAEAERLLSHEPSYVRSKERDFHRVRSLEQRNACPGAIREWYARGDAVTLLKTYSNMDWPLEPEQMEVVGDRVVFLNENQGVCRWAFRLDGCEDPGVDVQSEDAPWQSCDCSFAGFVAAQIFDWAEGWAQDSRSLWGAVTPETLGWLTQRFQIGPVARQQPFPTHRFFDERNRVTILDEHWWVRSASFADMDRLLDMLRPFYEEEF